MPLSSMVTAVGGHWELRAAASTKAVWWGMRLASLLTHLFLFLCTVTDFSAAEKAMGREILHACWPTIRTDLLPFWR